jgi:hypothetical protein
MPFSESSTIHSCSPGRKLCDWTLFDSIDENVPLLKPGFSPKNTFTVFGHDDRIVTDTGPAGAAAADGGGADALGSAPDDGPDGPDGPDDAALGPAAPPAPVWPGNMQDEHATRSKRRFMPGGAATATPVARNQPMLKSSLACCAPDPSANRCSV